MAVADDADDTDGGGTWLVPGAWRVPVEAPLAAFELEIEFEIEIELEAAPIVFAWLSTPRIAKTAGWVIQGSCLLSDLVDIADRSGLGWGW